MKRALIVWAAVLSVACATEDAPPPEQAADTAAVAQASLYDRLGGMPAISTVVDSMIARVARDERINKKFAKTDIPRLRYHLIEQVCDATGGPCDYSGRDMPTAHMNMAVTDGEFDALVEDLGAAMDQLGVPAAEKNELMSALAPMRAQIVTSPGPATGAALPSAYQPAAPLDSAKLNAGPARQ